MFEPQIHTYKNVFTFSLSLTQDIFRDILYSGDYIICLKVKVKYLFLTYIFFFTKHHINIFTDFRKKFSNTN